MWQKYKAFWLQKSFVYNVLIGLVFLGASFFVNYYANSYTTAHVGNNVTDIILDHLPIVDVHLIFSEGAIGFIIFLALVLLYHANYIPFALKSIAVFVLVRSFFLILTHLGPPLHG